MYCSSQRSDLFSQDEYLTPATQDGPTFVPTLAISSPSPIKKKSRSSRGSREMMIPDDVINEEDNEDEDDDPFQQQREPLNGGTAGGGAAPSKSRFRIVGRGGRMEGPAGGPSSSGEQAPASEDFHQDFRSMSQGLSQSVVDGIGSLRMNGSSSEEDEGIMQFSQDAAQGFRLKSVGADWNMNDTDGRDSSLRESISSSLNTSRGGGGSMEDRASSTGEEIVQVVSIPPCNANPFSHAQSIHIGGGGGHSNSSDNQGGGAGGGGAGEGRKRHRQRKIKIPCRDAGGGSAAISRYLMEFDQLETIGAGRFSMVYKCRKRLDGWIYAVKRTRHSLESDAEKEAAVREVFALAALQGCPQMVRYMGAWMEEKHLYIVTEFCPGGSLERAVFPRGASSGSTGSAFSFPSSSSSAAAAAAATHQKDSQGEGSAGSSLFTGEERDLLRVTRDIASALHFMHDRGIVHMDVKPGNILLAADGSFKLGDLGHAIKSDGSMMVAEGDERYLSMEVLKGLDLFKLSAGTEVPNYQSILGPNDVFGLGASLYEIASKVPLASSGPDFQALREGQLRPIPGLSQDFQDLLRDMLAPSVQARPTAADVVTRAEALLDTCGMLGGAEGMNGSSLSSSKLAVRCQAQHKRIQDLEEMVLSLTGFKN